MTARLNAFVESHPTGWNHDEWLALLADLGQGGTDVSNPDAIGAELERTRVAWELKQRGIPGLGRKRIESIANRFGTLYELQNATVEEIARVPGMNRALAENPWQAHRRRRRPVPRPLPGHRRRPHRAVR